MAKTKIRKTCCLDADAFQKDKPQNNFNIKSGS